MFILTREKIIWIIIAILGVIGISLGITGLAKPVIMEEKNVFEAIKEMNEETNVLSELKEHAYVIIVGGFFAILTGIVAVVIPVICIQKDIHPRYTKWTLLTIALIIASFSLSITALVMSADLNNLDWFDKLVESHGAPRGSYPDWWTRKNEF